MDPYVRNMLFCEDVRLRKGNRRKVDLLGLFSSVGPTQGEFPLRLSFSVYIVLTEGRGSGRGQVIIVEADDEAEVYVGDEHPISFGADPTHVVGVVIRIPLCTIEAPGLYWVDFCYNGRRIARQPLLAKEPS